MKPVEQTTLPVTSHSVALDGAIVHIQQDTKGDIRIAVNSTSESGREIKPYVQYVLGINALHYIPQQFRR